MLRNPAFQQDQLDLYKSQILQQWSVGTTDRSDRSQRMESPAAGERHFTTTPSTKASITSLTREDLIDFHGKYYHPEISCLPFRVTSRQGK